MISYPRCRPVSASIIHCNDILPSAHARGSIPRGHSSFAPLLWGAVQIEATFSRSGSDGAVLTSSRQGLSMKVFLLRRRTLIYTIFFRRPLFLGQGRLLGSKRRDLMERLGALRPFLLFFFFDSASPDRRTPQKAYLKCRP